MSGLAALSRAVILAVLIYPALLLAQNPYGRITGVVRDSAAGAVAGVSLTVVNTATNATATTKSNVEGNYEIPNLLPGEYRLVAEMSGFKRYERHPIELRVGDVLSVDIRLEVGGVTESVTVTSEAPLIESSRAAMGAVIDRRRLQDLPIPSGDPMFLIQLTPGTISINPPNDTWLPNGIGDISEFSVGGTRSRSSEFSLDGIPNMTQSGQVSFAPPAEMVQEFRVQTAPFDASVGHFTGAYVDMVIKSGTNAFHGDLFFSHTSRPLMGRSLFANRSIYDTRTGPVTQDKIDSFWPASRLNHYRGVVGGPVYLPKVYDGRNRTFFQYGMDVIPRVRNNMATLSVPTPRERGGDFSELLALGSQYQNYDPATIAAAPGGRFSRQPFAGNIVPASRMDAVAKRILGFYPAPNAIGTADGRNNFLSGQPRISTYNGNTARVDQTFSPSNRLYGSFTESHTDITSGDAFRNISTGTTLERRHRGLALGDVLMLRPNLVVDLRAGVTRYSTYTRYPSMGFDLASLGLAESLVKRLDRAVTTFPSINIDGFGALGADSGRRNPTTYYSFSGVVSYLRGNHSIRFGSEYRILRECDAPRGNVSPREEFGASWTLGPLDNSPAAPIGQGFASFLLGLPTGGWIDRNASFAQQSKYWSAFVQDDWKLTPRLTVNLGLRYELELPTAERFDRSNRGFDFGTTNPVESAARAAYARSPIPEIPADQFRTRGGLLFAGIGEVPRGLWQTDRNNFSPRLGIAWSVRPTTVIRSGYGIFFDPLGADKSDVLQQGFSQRTTLVPSLDNGLTFRATLGDPFPGGWDEPLGASGGLTTFLGRTIGFFAPQRRNGYVQRWSFGVQQEVRRVLVDVSYVGNRGTGLPAAAELNPIPAGFLSTSPARDQRTIDSLTQAVANPFFGLPQFAGGSLVGRNVQKSQLLRPYPHFTGIGTTTSSGFSWYHSLQARVEKRFSQGYTLGASYTWSKLMEAIEMLNPTDLHPHHVISPQDRTHVLALSGIYELPFGKGRRWLTEGWIRQVAGGWGIQVIYQAQSGPPLGFGNVIFSGDIRSIALPGSERTIERWFNTAGFDRDSRRQLQSNIRGFPLRLSGARAGGFNNFNASLLKTVTIREKLRLQIRIEAMDALNHPMFSPPNTNPTNSLFGQVSGVVSDVQRQVFLGAKLSW